MRITGDEYWALHKGTRLVATICGVQIRETKACPKYHVAFITPGEIVMHKLLKPSDD